MSISFNNKGIKEVYYKDKIIKEIYYGSQKIFPSTQRLDIASLQFGDRLGDMATVVGDYTDGNGQKYKFAVLDAQYMGKTTWASSLYGTDTGLPNYTTSNVESATESATYNTDYILNNYNGNLEAFSFARNAGTFELNEKTYQSQLPNAYELKQIYNRRNEIKELDPTAIQYPNYNIATWTFDSKEYAWSSNEFDDNISHYAINLSSSGYWNVSTKEDFSIGIIPIFEFPYE